MYSTCTDQHSHNCFLRAASHKFRFAQVKSTGFRWSPRKLKVWNSCIYSYCYDKISKRHQNNAGIHFNFNVFSFLRTEIPESRPQVCEWVLSPYMCTTYSTYVAWVRLSTRNCPRRFNLCLDINFKIASNDTYSCSTVFWTILYIIGYAFT